MVSGDVTVALNSSRHWSGRVCESLSRHRPPASAHLDRQMPPARSGRALRGRERCPGVRGPTTTTNSSIVALWSWRAASPGPSLKPTSPAPRASGMSLRPARLLESKSPATSAVPAVRSHLIDGKHRNIVRNRPKASSILTIAFSGLTNSRSIGDTRCQCLHLSLTPSAPLIENSSVLSHCDQSPRADYSAWVRLHPVWLKMLVMEWFQQIACNDTLFVVCLLGSARAVDG
jgi:hypothetical protein